MTQQTYTCTLTRWHKVAERLTREFTDLSKSAKAGLTEMTVSEYLGESQISRLSGFRDECLEKLESALRIQDAIVRIRQSLSAANEQHGVASALAEYDKLQKRATLLGALVSADDGQKVGLHELQHVKNPAKSDDWRERGQTKIPVAMLDSEQRVSLKNRADEAMAAAYAQADRVADLNKAQLQLELPPDIARLAGL